jgi:hypothetical protein
MATVIILSQKAQNPLTSNDHHTMATVITKYTFTNIITQGPKSLSNSKLSQTNQSILLIMQIDYSIFQIIGVG